MNSLPVSSDNIKSILKISCSNSAVDSLDILVILLREVLTQIGLGIFDSH